MITEKVNLYNSEMFLHSFAAAHVVGSMFFGAPVTKNQVQESFDFFSANAKRNIECNPWLSNFEKEKIKYRCDMFCNALKNCV